MLYPGFCGPSYTDTSMSVDCERAINIFPENIGIRYERSASSMAGLGLQIQPYPKASYVYKACPGTREWMDIGTGPIRGAIERGGWVYLVSGAEFYTISPTDVVSSPIAVANDGLPVYMASLNDQFFLVSAGVGYLDSGGGLAPIAGFTPSHAVGAAMLNTYFIALDDVLADALGGRFYISAPGDGSSWDPLDYEVVSSNPNKLVAIIVDHGELWVFGTQYTQVFYAGAQTPTDFPFVANQNGSIQMGIAARNAIAQIDNSLFWLGQDRNGQAMAVRANGYIPVRISTHAIEQAWQRYSTVSDCVVFPFQMDGHSFIQWNFPTANASWRYDASTDLWHEVGWFNSSTGNIDRHRGNCHFLRNGRHYLGDWETGQIWELSPSFYDDDGVELITKRRAPILAIENKRNFFYSVDLDMEVGIGNGTETPPLSDPQVSLRYSNDSGKTWSNELFRSAGKQGEYSVRVRWVRLGSGRNRVFEWSMSAAVPRTFINAYIEMGPGSR